MRLSKHDIKKLPKRLQAQIGKQFSSNGSTNRPSINNAKALATPTGKFCEYPSSSPAITLFNELNRIYGSALYSGGDVAHEVLIDGSPKRWRYDHLIVSKRVIVEFNGWQYHSRLDAFETSDESFEESTRGIQTLTHFRLLQQP